MVARAGGYSGSSLKGHKGVIQGDPIYLTILNVAIDAVLCHWISMVEDVEGDTGPESFGRSIHQLAAYFYAYDIFLAFNQEERLQRVFNVLMEIFDWFELRTNVGKKLSMD